MGGDFDVAAVDGNVVHCVLARLLLLVVDVASVVAADAVHT